MAAIFGGAKFFLKIGSPTHQLLCGLNILSKSLYLARFSRDKHFEKKFENSKLPPFLAREIFIETWKD